MTGSRRTRHLRTAASCLLAAAVVLGGASGCGQATPGDTVPEIAEQLARVDAAIAAGNDSQARTALEALIAETTEAQDAGDLPGDQAQNILTAAQDLLALLPAEPAPAPSETPSQDSEPADERGGPPTKDEPDEDKLEDEEADDDKPERKSDESDDKNNKGGGGRD